MIFANRLKCNLFEEKIGVSAFIELFLQKQSTIFARKAMEGFF